RRVRRHGPARWFGTVVGRGPGDGLSLALPGPERGPRLALRHAAGRALVRLLDPPGGVATDPPAAGGLGAGELLRAQRPLELMGTAGTRSRTRGRRQWSEPDARR
ncbi:hypothetical protein BGU92_18865, partial [Clostridioides difficile]